MHVPIAINVTVKLTFTFTFIGFHIDESSN